MPLVELRSLDKVYSMGKMSFIVVLIVLIGLMSTLVMYRHRGHGLLLTNMG